MRRLSDPVVVPGLTIMLVALIGIGVNTGSALLFRKSAKVDLNAKGAYLHWPPTQRYRARWCLLRQASC